MRRVLSGVSRSVAVLAVLVGGADRTGAGPLNPVDFSLSGSGVFPTAAGTFTFDTRNLTLTGPGIATPIQGSLSTTGVAVFDFNAITMASDQVFVSQNPFSNVTTPPLALLSRGDVTVNGTIDVSAQRGFSQSGFRIFIPGGPGGFASDSGPGAGGGFVDLNHAGPSPGGGGFGGGGGNGGLVVFNSGPPVYHPFAGGRGGSSYGDLAVSLQGGSGGGSLPVSKTGPNPGGGGGGALEVGAVGGITVGGSILANGNTGASGGSGGSGGGIFLHGDSVALLSLSVLSAQGGGDFPPNIGGGAGGGGGRVLIQVESGGFTGDVGSINVSGGPGSSLPIPPFNEPFSGRGAPGVIAINVVPEPASLVLLGIGLLGVLGCARYAGRRAAA